ncbi:formin-like protein 2 [Parasteatoda tepidariorum]|uniref:formin-like protein 2 n=1 Tax=Parasteatoda tepidariorum TaxID=114398 RepID=UPI0039BC6C50
MVPTEAELSKVERLSQKLNTMSYMAGFTKNIQLITLNINVIINATRSIKNSKRLKKLLEAILAFGNYMNSAKRGPAYGFKLQSLDMVPKTFDEVEPAVTTPVNDFQVIIVSHLFL